MGSRAASSSAILKTNSIADELANELKRIELQMQLGFITRRGLALVCRVSSDTIQEWERRGLAMHRPGTSESRCTVAAYRAFAEKAETFPGVKHAKAKARKKNKT